MAGTSAPPPFDIRTAPLEAQFLETMRGLQGRCRPWFTPPPPAVAIAVSGGGDSLALAHLLHQTRSAWGGHALICLMVDHGLQPGSRAVLEGLAPDLRARGFGVEILPAAAAASASAVSPPPRSNVQNWARRFRYACMTAWCRAHGVRILFVGHTQEDVVTGFLQGLKRGSGAAALPPWRLENGVFSATAAALFFPRNLGRFYTHPGPCVCRRPDESGKRTRAAESRYARPSGSTWVSARTLGGLGSPLGRQRSVSGCLSGRQAPSGGAPSPADGVWRLSSATRLLGELASWTSFSFGPPASPGVERQLFASRGG